MLSIPRSSTAAARYHDQAAIRRAGEGRDAAFDLVRVADAEAARLQSFPDGFNFVGAMNPAFCQIGNAVTPLLTYQIAAGIADSLRNAVIPSMAAE
jgi:site-specific DNA-cytosine methylase